MSQCFVSVPGFTSRPALVVVIFPSPDWPLLRLLRLPRCPPGLREDPSSAACSKKTAAVVRSAVKANIKSGDYY